MSLVDEFNQAVDDLIAITAVIQPVTYETLQGYAAQVNHFGEQVDDHTRSHAVGKMVDSILAASPMRSAMVALTCGALVEQGAHPYLAIHAIITRMGEFIGLASEFAEACLALAREDGVEGEVDPIQVYGGEVAPGMSEKAAAYSAMDIMCRPAIAMLARSKRARRAANDEGRMFSRIKKFPTYQPMLHWLKQMLAVLDDEELIVLHPEFQRGYRVKISGIAGNHQLFVFLEDLLIGDPAEGYLPGEKPSALTLQAAQGVPMDAPVRHTFIYQFANWDQTWIWGEGVPMDIARFDGVRVIVVEPVPYVRIFEINNPFYGLEPEIELVEMLDTETVSSWMARLASTEKPSAKS